MGADWSIMIARAGDFFDILKWPTAILFGVGLGMWILDWLLDRFGGGGGGYSDQPAQGSPQMQRPGRGGRHRKPKPQRPPTWRDEPYYKTNSWEVLEDRAQTVNGWNREESKGGE